MAGGHPADAVDPIVAHSVGELLLLAPEDFIGQIVIRKGSSQDVVVVCGAAQSVSLCHSFLLYLLLILLSSVPLLLGCSNNNSQNSNVLGPVLVFSPCLSHSYLSVSLYPSAG